MSQSNLMENNSLQQSAIAQCLGLLLNIPQHFVEVFIHREFGMRHLNVTSWLACAAIPGVFLYTMPSWPLGIFFVLFNLAYGWHIYEQNLKMFAGGYTHSYYNGRPFDFWFRIPLPMDFVPSELHVKCIGEPLLVAIVGGVLQTVGISLGGVFVLLAFYYAARMALVRYLAQMRFFDEMDAAKMAEHMHRAVRDQKDPRHVDGVMLASSLLRTEEARGKFLTHLHRKFGGEAAAANGAAKPASSPTPTTPPTSPTAIKAGSRPPAAPPATLPTTCVHCGAAAENAKLKPGDLFRCKKCSRVSTAPHTVRSSPPRAG